MQINDLIRIVHQRAIEKGFYDEGNNLANLMMLMVTEQGEAYDELRVHPANYVYIKNGKPEGFLAEIADVAIRLFDMIGFLENENPQIDIDVDGEITKIPFDFEKIIELKMIYNASRPHKHGKNF